MPCHCNHNAQTKKHHIFDWRLIVRPEGLLLLRWQAALAVCTQLNTLQVNKLKHSAKVNCLVGDGLVIAAQHQREADTNGLCSRDTSYYVCLPQVLAHCGGQAMRRACL